MNLWSKIMILAAFSMISLGGIQLAQAQTSWDLNNVGRIRQEAMMEIWRKMGERKTAVKKEPAKEEAKGPQTQYASLRSEEEIASFIKELQSKESSLVSVSVVYKKKEDEKESRIALYTIDSSKSQEEDFSTSENKTIISRSEGFAKMVAKISSESKEIHSVTLVEKGDVPTLVKIYALPDATEKAVTEKPVKEPRHSYARRGNMLLE